jgi:hypothetical protein
MGRLAAGEHAHEMLDPPCRVSGRFAVVIRYSTA